VPSGSANVVLSGAGSAIMGLQQNLTIDSVDKTVTLIYIDGTNGWRIF
jgi:homoserine kinase